MTAYRRLQQYLDDSRRPRITLRFEELEQVLGGALPAAAQQRREWWVGSNTEAPQFALAGWDIEQVYLGASIVTFKRRTSTAR